MPEPTPPPDAGGTTYRREGPLTPAAIDAVLADFRRWLEDLAVAAPQPPPEPEPAIDLATLVGAFTALRHEVHLQTKAARAQSEQFAQALDAIHPPAEELDVRPLVTALAEAYDTLTRAAKEMEQLRPKTTWLGQLFARRALGPDRLAATVAGLRMSEKRVERLMREVGLEPVECVGQAFDPDVMEAVEAVADSGRPAGTVMEELRRGYRWRARVFRYAQVRVAK